MLALATIYLLLRGRLGLVLTAIRDDEVAARSSGARVGLARMLVFVVAAVGCGAAGAVLAISQLSVQPSAVFSVQWTAEMVFATIIGGIGTIEGPIIGTIVYFVLQQTLASYDAWYLIVLGPGRDRRGAVRAARAVGADRRSPERPAVPGRLLAVDAGEHRPARTTQTRNPAAPRQAGTARVVASRAAAHGPARSCRASVPVWSIGFLSPVPFLVYAVMPPGQAGLGGVRGLRPRPWRSSSRWARPGSDTAPTAAVGLFIIAPWPGARRRTRLAVPALPGVTWWGPAPSVRQRNQAALAAARDRLERSKEARHLVATNPALARDLRIGRPDLPREYDDGGLVDVNHVPVAVFSSGLGLTPIEARDVLAARDKLGRFVSAEELCEYTQLSPDRVDELRDLMIFT